jgi:hypothetical protein
MNGKLKIVTGYEAIGEQCTIACSEGWEMLLTGIVEGREIRDAPQPQSCRRRSTIKTLC